MPHPSHLPKHFTAQKKFTDRVELLDLFRHSLCTPQSPLEYRVLVIYGAGGHGKTRLCREFLADLNTSDLDVGWAHLDFASPDARVPEQAILRIRLALGERAGIAFPAFNRAFISHFSKVRPGASARSHYPELFGPNLPDWTEIADLAANIAGGITPVAMFKQVTDWVRQWYEARGRTLIHEIEGQDAQQLYESLPKYLGADVLHYLEHQALPKRLVVFLDTYEQLWLGRNGLQVDKWVQALAAEMPGVLLVILGRDRLRWDELDPSWADSLDQHLLGQLSDSDADQFLLSVPIPEADIRSRIIQAARGVPFYLDLEADIYEALRNKDIAPCVEQFGGAHPEIIERFMSHCDAALSAALRALAHARVFNEVLFDTLRQAMPGEVHQIGFAELKAQSFITVQPDGTCTMHALMRDYLMERTQREDPSLACRLHRTLAAYWQPRSEVSTIKDVCSQTIRALDEASYHLEKADPGSFACSDWLDKQLVLYRKAYVHQAVEPVIQRQLALREGQLGQEHPAVATSLYNLGRVYVRQRRRTEAEALYRRSLAIREQQLGQNHPDVAESLSGLADLVVTLHSEFETAINMRRRALAICLAAYGERHETTARYMSELGSALSGRGVYDEAESLIRKALSVREEVLGANHPDVFSSLGTLAIFLANYYGNYQEEASLYRRILEFREKNYPKNHPEILGAMNNLGYALIQTGDYDEAEQILQRALEITAGNYPPDHPAIALRYMNLGSLLRRKGRYIEAEPRLRRSVEIREREYGEDHPTTAFSYLNLGLLLLDMDKLEEAVHLLHKALEIREARHGRRHKRTAHARMQLSKALRLQGELAEAEAQARDALAVMVEVHVPGHPWIAQAWVALGDVLRDKGDILDAKECFFKAVTIFEQKFGPSHPDAFDCRQKLMVCYISTNRS